MKKLSTLVISCLVLIFSCQKKDMRVKDEAEDPALEASAAPAQRCASQEVLNEKLAADPGLRKRMQEVEDFTQQVIKNKEKYKGIKETVIEIPVYFHVLYRDASEDISDEQLQSQIDVLNEDFTKKNADISKVPAHFADVATDVQVKFTWAPGPAQTKRKYSSKRQWSTNDDMKFDAKGGSNVYQPEDFLNIWVVNKIFAYGSTILGYAQFPGGAWATDGIVLGHNFTGRKGKVSAPFDLGRTATHEVGHWLNLRHIWGDATCGNDHVDDTPQHNTSNGGCPAADHRSTCTGTPLEMWMNYMDYTYDQCMYMFTNGQKTRMRSVFTSGGYRAALGQP
jgi:hypothetical protein